MRLLFLSSVFPRPDNRTHGIFSYHLCSALAVHNEVKVVSPRSWVEWLRNRRGRTLRDSAADGAARQLEAIYPRYYYPPRLLRNAHGWFMWHSVKRSLQALLRSFRPDCVVSYWSYPDGEVANRVARIAKAPSVVMVGGSDVLLCDQSGRREKVAAVLRSADAVVTVGQDLREKVVEMGVRPEHVFVTTRGVDTHTFCPGDRREARRKLGLAVDVPTLLWVGRMVPVKGLPILLEACAQLHAAGQRFQLCLVGDGPMRSSLEKTCADRGLGNLVRFAGICAHHQLPDWYRAADVTVLPSFSEGVPNVLRESLACGTPFVASRVGGIAEISTHPANRLIPAGDAVALTDALASILSQPPAAKLAAVQVMDWSESAASLLEVIRGL